VEGRPVYRVVVAEDHPVIRELLVQQLQDAGHTVVGVAEDGVRVVDVVKQERPDVVIMDRGLPLQDGLAACATIAAQAPTPVVVLSGYLSADPEAEVLGAGAHAFLPKPYSIDDLDEALEQAVRRFARARARLQAGPAHPASFAS
jgi:CheY-like chemotaxis protein